MDDLLVEVSALRAKIEEIQAAKEKEIHELELFYQNQMIEEEIEHYSFIVKYEELLINEINERSNLRIEEMKNCYRNILEVERKLESVLME